MADNDNSMLAPPEDLIVRKCWVPDCRSLAAFRDGKGWWWCMTHQDHQGDWGVAQVASYDEAHKNAKKAMEAERQARQDAERERDKWKWEYENVCKFATQYEAELDKARGLLQKVKDRAHILDPFTLQEIDAALHPQPGAAGAAPPSNADVAWSCKCGGQFPEVEVCEECGAKRQAKDSAQEGAS